jgi:F420-dependent methylenetetrahydromethanopterin dehydrogenase
MITSSTFIASQRAKDLLCALYVEYGCWGETRPILIALRAELGPVEYARFQKDLLRLMKRTGARNAVHQIIRAAILRAEEQVPGKKYLRTIYQPDAPA